MMVQTLKIGTELRSENYTYYIEKILGEGSFGITYLAKTCVLVKGPLGELSTDIKVCIKEFFMKDLSGREMTGKVTDSSSSTLVKSYGVKFRREAENLSHLRHPNIVKVLEVFDANNTHYYVMEYIDGMSLDDYISKKGGLPEKEAIDDIRVIGGALGYMHSKKMLHLDLKPKNVMRRSDGQLILIDFGLSKQYDEKGEAESSTTVGLGTPGYAPIEQSNMKKGMAFPATLDVYALGATLFKMLTGQTPPIAADVLNHGIPTNTLLQRQVSDGTINLIKSSMSPTKAQRPQTVNAFIQLIGNISNDSETTDIKIDTVDVVNVDVPITSEDKEKEKSVNLKRILLIACSFIVGICIVLYFLNPRTDNKTVGDEATTEMVTNKIVDAEDGSKCTYTGTVKDGKPEGEGTATYKDGRCYKGNFSAGTRTADKAVFTWPNGDKYEGSFIKNHFGSGKFTAKESGSYFIGLFKDDKPHEGTWYDAKGNFLQSVKP